MLHDEGMAVAALQECPGLGVDPSLTVLHQFLRQLAPSPEKLVESQPLDDVSGIVAPVLLRQWPGLHCVDA